MDQPVLTTLEAYIASAILRKPGHHIEPEAAILSSGLIDSFSLVDLALFVEDTFHVRIEDTELNAQSFDNLRELAALIESRQTR